MTPDHDLDRDLARDLEDLLNEGPTRMPGRVFDTIVERVSDQPQVRRSRLHRRYRSVTPTVKLLAAAALLLSAGIATGAIWSPPSRRATDLDARPSPSADPTTNPRTLLGELTDEWYRAEPAGSPPRLANVLGWIYDGASLSYEGAGAFDLTSTMEAVGQDELRVVLKDASPECAAGDVGRYRWSLSPSGNTVVVEYLEDACAARAAVFPATYRRVDCLSDQNSCLGRIDAGTHGSIYLDALWPRWQYGWSGARAGSLTYTVPDGWSAVYDFPHRYGLRPADAYAGDIDGTDPGIWILAGQAGAHLTPTCEFVKDDAATAPRLASELQAWATSRLGVVASQTGSLTIDGHPATWVDLELAPGRTGPCTDDPTHQVGLYANNDGPDEGGWALGPGRERHIFVDVDSTPVVVVLRVSDPTTFDEFVTQAMPIVASFRFSPAD